MLSRSRHRPSGVAMAALHQTSPGPMPLPADSYLLKLAKAHVQLSKTYHLRFLQNFPGGIESYLSTSRRHSMNIPYTQCICSHLYLRSEEHTSELQSQSNLVCRLLL